MDAINNNRGTLIIRNLDPDIVEDQLCDALSQFGEIIYCKIPTDIKKFDGEKRYVSRGYAYVQFLNEYDAINAIHDLKDAEINGRPIEILPLCRRQHEIKKQPYKRCFIKNIPEYFNNRHLHELFEEFGTPISYEVMFDDNGKSKQFGFCTMSNHEEAERAAEGLNGRIIDELCIVCCCCMSKEDRLEYLENQEKNNRSYICFDT